MTKFSIILFLYIALLLIGLYGHGIKRNTIIIIRNIFTKRDEMGVWLHMLFTDLIVKAVAISMLFMLIIPMFKDIAHMRNRNFEIIRGEVVNRQEFMGLHFLYQRITINGTKINLFISEPVKVGKKYTIHYLPNSQFGVDVFSGNSR